MGYKIIVRIKGGLGNQMFCYAAARSLALRNNSELIIDHVTGFIRDKQYHRKYALGIFNIPCRLATPSERLEPFERYRRGVLKYISRKKFFFERTYVEQEKKFDERLLFFKVNKNITIDGLWISEKYFKNHEQSIRRDFAFHEPKDAKNQAVARKILNDPEAVSLHIRWYSPPDGKDKDYNLCKAYYSKAIDLLNRKLTNPHFYLFSDFPEQVQSIFKGKISNHTIIRHNQEEVLAYADMWLMSLCHHHVTANSTFSWWGAWLNKQKNKIVVTPSAFDSKVATWGIEGQIPDEWIVI